VLLKTQRDSIVLCVALALNTGAQAFTFNTMSGVDAGTSCSPSIPKATTGQATGSLGLAPLAHQTPTAPVGVGTLCQGVASAFCSLLFM